MKIERLDGNRNVRFRPISDIRPNVWFDPLRALATSASMRRVEEDEIVDKLQRLEQTPSHLERNALALELSDTNELRVFDPLVRLIQRPDLVNHRGTLLYCLENYDCSSIADLLLELVETGNFEVSAQAELILDEQGLR